jgi:hypothetical protein
MEAYKKGLQLGLRFNTTVGPLSIEQLFQLKLGQLETIIRNQKKVVKKNDDDELSFLDASSKADPVEQLKFDILKDVYLTKKAEAEEARLEKERKENREKIMSIISRKKDVELEGKTVAELEAML